MTCLQDWTSKYPRPSRGRRGGEGMEGKIRPELKSVTKLHETRNIDEAAAMLNQGGWVIIAIAKGEDGYLFSLGYMEINFNRVLMPK